MKDPGAIDRESCLFIMQFIHYGLRGKQAFTTHYSHHFQGCPVYNNKCQADKSFEPFKYISDFF